MIRPHFFNIFLSPFVSAESLAASTGLRNNLAMRVIRMQNHQILPLHSFREQ